MYFKHLTTKKAVLRCRGSNRVKRMTAGPSTKTEAATTNVVWAAKSAFYGRSHHVTREWRPGGCMEGERRGKGRVMMGCWRFSSVRMCKLLRRSLLPKLPISYPSDSYLTKPRPAGVGSLLFRPLEWPAPRHTPWMRPCGLSGTLLAGAIPFGRRVSGGDRANR